MADVTLAEFDGNVWLVAGEAHLDDFLRDNLPPGMSVETVVCASFDEVEALWIAACGPDDADAIPFLINPAIVARARRAQAGHRIRFAPWSAAIDAEGQDTLRRVAAQLASSPDASVVIRLGGDPAGQAELGALRQLRLMLVEGGLTSLGVAAGSLSSQICATLPTSPDGGTEFMLDVVDAGGAQ